MALKYRVSIGTNKFEFADGMTAMGVAELLVNNFVPGTYSKELTALVEVMSKREDTDDDDE